MTEKGQTAPASILDLPARITLEDANDVAKMLCRAVDDSTDAELRVDLSAVNHCDSAGVAALIEAKAYANQHQRTLCYLSPQSQLKDLATFLKVDEILFNH